MRPVLRGPSPQPADFAEYRDAFPELLSRLGPYCSYCERRIPTGLAVEHIQPKGLSQYAHLIGNWDNFLLACTNCNSTKGDKDVQFPKVYLPDRDNTAYAFVCTELDGAVNPAARLGAPQQLIAKETLQLVGLDKPTSAVTDANGTLVAIDRVAQRRELWAIATESRQDLVSEPTQGMRKQILKTALGHGFFSIWMTVFETDPVMRTLLIQGFQGTATDCFHPTTTAPITPRPANPALTPSGRI